MKKIIFLFFFFSLMSFGQETRNNQNDFFLAETYYRQGEYEKATQIYKKLYEKSKFNTTYLQRLVSCYQETNQFLEAENLLKKRIEEVPNQSYLYVLLGYNFEKVENIESANKNYEKAFQYLEKEPAYASTIARFFKEYSKLDLAIKAYEKAMEQNENANYDFQIAQIYGEKGDYKKMFESYIDLLDKSSEYLNLVQRYASTYITDDAESETNVLFRKTLLKKSISNPKDEWNVLLSWLFAQQRDYQKALIQEKALYQRSPDNLMEIFSLGKIAFDNGDFDAAKSCFEFINQESNFPEERIDANVFLAKIAIEKEQDDVQQLFDNLFAEFGKNTATIALQTLYADFLTFQKNNPDKATEVLNQSLEFANSKFDKARIKLKLGDVLVFRGLYNKALIYFSQIQTQLKGSELAQEARFKVAQTSYFKGDFPWAKAQLKVLKSSTTQLIANDAVDLYLKIVDNEPVDSIPSGLTQLAKAELLAYQNKNEEALVVVESLFSDSSLGNNPLSFKANPGDVIYDDALFFKAETLIKLKKYDEAILSLAEIVAADNQGFLIDDVYFNMAELYHYHIKDLEKAKEYYQKIIFEHPSSIYLVEARKRFRKLRGDNI